MKTLGLFCSMLFLFCNFAAAAGAPAEEPRVYFVGLPPAAAAVSAADIQKAVLKLVLEARVGDRVRVYDAQSLAPVADMTIPESATTRARLRTLGPGLSAVSALLKRAGASEAKPSEANQVRIPGFVALASRMRTEGSATRIVIFGSAFYQNAKDPAASFAPGWVPSDGHITAAPDQSVFSAAAHHKCLDGTTVDFCVTEPEACGEVELGAAKHFWGKYIRALGGTLNSCETAPALTVELALKGESRQMFPEDSVDPRDTEVTMRRVGPDRRVERRPQPAGTPAPLSAAAQERLTAAAAAVPSPTNGHLIVAAVWTSEGQADVDLWVLPGPGKAELNFRQSASPEGRYLRDVQRSFADTNDRVWGESWEVVDLDRAVLADVGCWVDLYANHGGGDVQGLVRVRFEGKTVDVPFTLSGAGDLAAGKGSRENSSKWVRIDVRRALISAGAAPLPEPSSAGATRPRP